MIKNDKKIDDVKKAMEKELEEKRKKEEEKQLERKPIPQSKVLLLEVDANISETVSRSMILTALSLWLSSMKLLILGSPCMTRTDSLFCLRASSSTGAQFLRSSTNWLQNFSASEDSLEMDCAKA